MFQLFNGPIKERFLSQQGVQIISVILRSCSKSLSLSVYRRNKAREMSLPNDFVILTTYFRNNTEVSHSKALQTQPFLKLSDIMNLTTPIH